MKYFSRLKCFLYFSLNRILFILFVIGITFLVTSKVFAVSIVLNSPREISELINESIPYNILQDVDVDSDGNVYIVDYAYSFVFKYNGSTWSTIGEGEEAIFTFPRDVTLDKNNYIYVVSDNGHIYKFSPAGVFEEDFETESYLTDVAFDSENNMYVVIGESYIAKWEVDNWYTYAESSSGIFTGISDIAFDDEDTLYVLDEGARKVMTYNSVDGWETLPSPTFSIDELSDIKVDSNGTVYYVDNDEGWMAMYDPSTSTWSNYDAGGSFITPNGITVYEEGDDLILYVTDGSAESVFKFVYDYPYERSDSDESEEDEDQDQNQTFREDMRCHWVKPDDTTWIISKPSVINGVFGINLTWTQYSADKVDIKIDDGTGSFPWKISKTANDGNEFIPNVAGWQQIKIKPYNHCKAGNDSSAVSYMLYPSGWFNVK